MTGFGQFLSFEAIDFFPKAAIRDGRLPRQHIVVTRT
jgi:hypothetical protein